MSRQVSAVVYICESPLDRCLSVYLDLINTETMMQLIVTSGPWSVKLSWLENAYSCPLIWWEGVRFYPV